MIRKLFTPDSKMNLFAPDTYDVRNFATDGLSRVEMMAALDNIKHLKQHMVKVIEFDMAQEKSREMHEAMAAFDAELDDVARVRRIDFSLPE
jgi:hypothetical protein